MRMPLRPIPDAIAGLLVAIAATVVINLPLWHGLLFAGEASKPDVVIESTDEKFYLARINEISDGYPWAGHPFLFERREQRYPLGNFWEAALGLPMHWLDLEIKTVSAGADALFPLLLVLILWTATRPVLPEKRWRLLLIGILFLGFETSWWRRPISPQETMVLPLLYLWALLTPRRAALLPTAIRGALIGLMTLSYPFHWTYCLAVEGLLTLLHLAHDPTWTARLKRVAALGLPLLLCASPWLLMMLSIRGSADYAQTLERLGMLDRRIPSGIPLQMIVIAAGAATLVVRIKVAGAARRTADVLLILLFASLAVLNQPLVTGKEAEFSSHYRQIIVFPLWIALLWAIRTVIVRYRMLAVAVPIIGLLVVGGRTVQATTAHWGQYEEARLQTAQREQTNELMATLNALPGERVILAGRDLALDLAVYTSHYPFFAHETHMYLMGNEEIWNRAAIQQALFPGEEILPRSVVGSSYLNRALHARTVCRLRSLVRLETADCAVPAEQYLPERWKTLRASSPPRESIVSALREAGVDYALMRDPPEWLAALGTIERNVAGYTLLRFDWSRP